MAIGRKLLWTALGGFTMKTARNLTRNALHDATGRTRLPTRVRRQRNFESALMLAAGTGVVLALADVLQEQGKTAARARRPPEARA
jgi:hypothetical protein